MPATPHQDREKAVRDAIRTLYSTFAKYEGKESVENGLYDYPDDAILRSKELKHLTGVLLARFAEKAMTTIAIGSVDHFKHFLPRLFELIANEGDIDDTPLEIVFSKLSYADWRQWPKAEQAAVDAYIMNLWLLVVSGHPSTPQLGSVLCGIGRAEGDLTPYLDAWSNDDSAEALEQLSIFIDENNEDLRRRGRLQNAFWSDSEPQMKQVIHWLTRPETAERLERIFFVTSNLAAAASVANQKLSALRTKQPG